MVEAPADIPDKAKKLAISIAQKAVGSLEGAGVFAVELFLTQDGKVCFKKSAFYFKDFHTYFWYHNTQVQQIKGYQYQAYHGNLITVVFDHICNGSFSMVDCDHTAFLPFRLSFYFRTFL